MEHSELKKLGALTQSLKKLVQKLQKKTEQSETSSSGSEQHSGRIKVSLPSEKESKTKAKRK